MPGHVHLFDVGQRVKKVIDASVWEFEGPARIFHSQDDVCHAILSDRITAGDVVVIRYEGPKGGPGMQEMLYPTS